MFAKAEKQAASEAQVEAEDISATETSPEDFVLKDSFGEETEEESLFDTSDMASDEDILNAEKELDNKGGEGHV